MRISEKTLELNFCAQFNEYSPNRLIWFGLTQKQEAKAGFDACTKLGGRLLIFQFKASKKTMIKTGERRFLMPHHQMVNLQARCKKSRSVFYTFPLIGTTLELLRNPNLLAKTWLLDVYRIPPSLPLPTASHGGLRKNKIHYVDVLPGQARIHSEPVKVSLVQAADFVIRGFPGADGFQRQFDNSFDLFWEFRDMLDKNSLGVVVFKKDKVLDNKAKQPLRNK